MNKSWARERLVLRARRKRDAPPTPACDPRYDSFIDHIVLDKREAAALTGVAETVYAPGEKHVSDHCPIAVTLLN